jgi:hypothetical protein
LEEIKLKRISIVVITGLAFSLLTNTASIAAVKAGGGCSKLGSTTTTDGYQYSCIKSGKKLIWKKGTKASAPPKQTNFKNLIPITLPVAAGKITFANILDNLSLVPQAAYDSVQKTLSTNLVPVGNNSFIWVGPNTKTYGNKNPADAFTLASKLWSGFTQPTSFGAFYFSTEDVPLAEAAYLKWASDNKVPGVASDIYNQCRQGGGPGVFTGLVGDCKNADAGTFGIQAIGKAKFGVSTNPEFRNGSFLAGGIEIHEFTHFVQTSQFKGLSEYPTRDHHAVNPCWLQEGQANFAALSANSDSFKAYLGLRNGEALYRTNSAGVLGPRDLVGVSNYISLATLDTCFDSYNWGYGTGVLIVEALSAIGGVQSTLALTALQARGYSFSDAFKLVYGISWLEAQPILAKALVGAFLQPDINVTS